MGEEHSHLIVDQSTVTVTVEKEKMKVKVKLELSAAAAAVDVFSSLRSGLQLFSRFEWWSVVLLVQLQVYVQLQELWSYRTNQQCQSRQK